MNHREFRVLFLSLVLFLGSISVQAQEPYDYVIRGGKFIDGTGNPSRSADIAIHDGRIAVIGRVTGVGRKEVDANGLVIAPGFIDVHTHAEGIEDLPEADNFLRMGVTTLVLGNCGSSRLNLGEYFYKLEQLAISPNITSLIGHGTVRAEAMGGSFDRAPTGSELQTMKHLIQRAMYDGALGMSTGLIYLPGTFADTEELITLAQVVSDADGIYASHMRNEGRRILSALEELFQIAEKAKVRAHVSHIKLSGKASWGKTEAVLKVIHEARKRGLDITQDQYMYAASSTGIQSRIPNWAREGGREEFLKRLSDPVVKKRMIVDLKEDLKQYGHEDFSYAMIANYQHDSSLNGMNISQAAAKVFGTNSLDDQIELILQIYENGGASGVFHSMNENDLKEYLRHPNTMIAADSGVRKYNEGVPHPRGYGNNARCLARFVRELKFLPIEDAIRRMTFLPATVFGIRNRGVIRVGLPADLVVFDPGLVADQATFTEPHHYATGFRMVMVNGVPVVENDVHNGSKPGKIIRSSSYRK
ncbi:MAG TPA: D-aminoacylase [Verrucomicrobiales bacterium]|nr:D-aminoacylase [Verrucomicrobiales bacterium]